MTEPKLNYKIIGVISILLLLSMSLQSMVLLFLNLRTALQADVRQAALHLEHSAKYLGRISSNSSYSFSDVYFELSNKTDPLCTAIYKDNSISFNGSCYFSSELTQLATASFNQQVTKIGYEGLGWHVLSMRSETVLITTPVRDMNGEIIASIGTVRSLLPIYKEFTEDAKVALIYLLVNLLVFTAIGFFRLMKYIFRPMEKLVELTETYRAEDDSGLLLSENTGVFRTLTVSLNSMLSRIESDNKQLRHSVAELEKLNNELKQNQNIMLRTEKLASIGRLSAGLAHEVGNPLAIIQGYIELLNRSDLSEEERNEFAQKADVELDRLKKIIKQMLNFARPIEAVTEAVNIHQVIDEVVEFIQIEKKLNDCKVEKHYEAQNNQLGSDPNGLRQVFLNCLLNAIDSMEESPGENTITIYTRDIVNETEDGVQIIIKDSGKGIDQENLEKIFDPFFTTKEIGKGTGLGLFVCHTILERLQGQIQITNCENQGAEVIIELPKEMTSNEPA